MLSIPITRLAVLIAFVTLISAGVVRAAGTAVDSVRTLSPTSAFTTTSPPRALSDHGHSQGGLWRPAFILAAGGLAAVWSHDEESPDAARRFLDRPGWDTMPDFGNVYGDGVVLGGVSLGVLAVGRLGHHAATAAAGGDLCEAFLVSSGAVWAIKYAVNRRRPSGGPYSFPSGHTTVAFAVVPVLGHHLGWRASVPAALLAVATGLGRMEERRHFQSDVLAGAALGLACGDIVAGPGFLPGRARAVVLPRAVAVAVPF